MFSLLATVLLAGTFQAAPEVAASQAEGPSAAPNQAPNPAPEYQTAPGGYRTLGEQREREGEPPDGDDELTIGSVLFSLGLLRVGAAVLTVWMAGRPTTCPDAEQSCTSMQTYGWFGVGEGGLLVGTGIVYLAIGASRRGQHQRWRRGESLGRLPRLSPWVTRSPDWRGDGHRLTGGGVSVQLRF